MEQLQVGYKLFLPTQDGFQRLDIQCFQNLQMLLTSCSSQDSEIQVRIAGTAQSIRSQMTGYCWLVFIRTFPLFRGTTRATISFCSFWPIAHCTTTVVVASSNVTCALRGGGGGLLPGYDTRFFLQRGCCCQGKEVVPVDHIRGKGLSSRLTCWSNIRLTGGFEPCPKDPHLAV